MHYLLIVSMLYTGTYTPQFSVQQFEVKDKAACIMLAQTFLKDKDTSITYSLPQCLDKTTGKLYGCSFWGRTGNKKLYTPSEGNCN